MITKRVIIGKVEIIEDGQVFLREDTIYEEDGVELVRKYYRRVITPLDDPKDEDPKIQAVINIFVTPDKVKDYQDKIDKALKDGIGLVPIKVENEIPVDEPIPTDAEPVIKEK